jgi:quercetin dioxygenase-like cupin family protein
VGGDASRWQIARLSEIEAIPGPGTPQWASGETVRWKPVRRQLDIGAFGVNAYVAAEAGDEVVERHTETARQHEEAYVVLEGSATFTLGGEETEVGAGAIVFVRDPHLERSAVAREPGTTVLAIGGRRGEPYADPVWEYWYTATPLGLAGDHARAIAELKRGLELHPGHRMLLYQLACWEAVAGETDAALSHLGEAVAQSELMREWAQTDELLDSIWTDSRFPTA